MERRRAISRSRRPIAGSSARGLAMLMCCACISCDQGDATPEVSPTGTVVMDSLSVRTSSETLRVLGAAISADFFTDEARALLGRVVLPSDFAAEAPDVVLLTHELWTRLGSSPELVGAELVMGDAAPRVVGVMPEGFESPAGVDLWFPRRAP